MIQIPKRLFIVLPLLAGLRMALPAQAELIVPSSAVPSRTAPAAAPAPAQSGAGIGAAAAPAVERERREEVRFSPGAIYSGKVLSEDTVWRGEVLVDGSLVVAPQATLTVEPGTVVRFRHETGQGAVLVVQGRLVALGSKDSPVVFGSMLAPARPGDWQGLMLLGSDKKNVLENCRVEGAQTGLEVLYSQVTLKGVRVEQSGTGFRFQDALVQMEGGGVSESDTGLSLVNSEANLKNLNVVGNRQGVSAQGSSLYLYEANISGNQAGAVAAADSRVKLQGGAVLGNGSGVTLAGCEGSITGVRVVRNRDFGLSLAASRVKVSGNVVTENSGHGLVVADGAAVAWDNAILGNTGYDLYNKGVEAFRAPGNWWGGPQPRLFENGGRGRVLYQPALPAWPQPPLAPAAR